MTRRLALSALALGLLAACSGDPEAGPVPVAWDRDGCDRCGMTLSEPRFAAQIRSADQRAHRFDDLGCALLWLDDHPEASPPLEIWVGDPAGEGWLDARSAGFRAGQRTPMGYGFAASLDDDDAALTLAAAWERIRERERERRSPSR